MTIESILLGVLGREQGYVNHPDDPGGATCWGITEAVARTCGYPGDMAALPKDTAYAILLEHYVTGPHFDRVLVLSPILAAELVDIGVNQGTGIAVRFLQRALNCFNKQETLYLDGPVDGQLGPATLHALRAFLTRVGAEDVMRKALTCLRGARFIESGEHNPALESFEFGWFAQRINF